MKVIIEKSFAKAVRKLSGKQKKSVADVIEEVRNAESVDDITDCIRLVNFHTVYRIRIGDYRAFFTLHIEVIGNTVKFRYLVSRGQAYDKKMEASLKRLDD